MGAPDIPAPPAPPAPPDEASAYFRELARSATDRKLRQSQGAASAFKNPGAPAGGSYALVPGMKKTTGT